MRRALLRWQYEGYPEYHRSRANLLIHIFAVPAFQLSTASVAFGVWSGTGLGIIASLLTMAAAFAVQGVGHKREVSPSIPFEGPVDAVTRIFAEQFVTFPRFVFSGGWSTALRTARNRPSH